MKKSKADLAIRLLVLISIIGGICFLCAIGKIEYASIITKIVAIVLGIFVYVLSATCILIPIMVFFGSRTETSLKGRMLLILLGLCMTMILQIAYWSILFKRFELLILTLVFFLFMGIILILFGDQ